MTIGRKLSDAGLRVMGVPKTIDNDLEMTDATFGFDTAVEVATEGIDRLFTTATSHSRVFVVELMGRYAGVDRPQRRDGGGSTRHPHPRDPVRPEAGRDMIARREARGARFAIVVVAEGAQPEGGERSIIGKRIDQAERLGGVGALVAEELERLTGKEARTVVLGHLLRGGTPTSLDRLLGLRFGAAAIRGLEEGHRGRMVALDPPVVNFVPLVSATKKLRTVPLDCDTILAGATSASASATSTTTRPLRRTWAGPTSTTLDRVPMSDSARANRGSDRQRALGRLVASLCHLWCRGHGALTADPPRAGPLAPGSDIWHSVNVLDNDCRALSQRLQRGVGGCVRVSDGLGRATIGDVADSAGVSIATVSRRERSLRRGQRDGGASGRPSTSSATSPT